ncbi:MAG: hypothetical protein AAF467_23380 [Actinomycetota bacterium]
MRAVVTDGRFATPEEIPLATAGLDLGRLADSLDAAGPLAPTLIAAVHASEVQLVGARSGQRQASWQRLRLGIPGGGIVDVRLLAIPWPSLQDAIPLLEDLYYESFSGERADWDVLNVPDVGHLDAVSPVHQLVFVPDSQEEPSFETVQRLVYRADLDAIEEHSSIAHPEELNRRPGQLAAVGAYGAVLWGHQDYVESALIISSALAVAATACVHDVRRKALAHLAVVDGIAHGDEQATLRAELARNLTRLQVDLTFGAEAAATVRPLFRSLRPSAYHRALFDSTGVIEESRLVNRMIDRLLRVVEVEARHF